jgi:pectate lyase
MLNARCVFPAAAKTINKTGLCRAWLMTLGMLMVMFSRLGQAANINWAAPQKISGDGDVSVNGTLVRAINATPTNTTLAVDVTLNGVAFVAARKNGSSLYLAPGGDTFLPSDTGSVGPTAGGFQAFGQGGAPFNSLSAAYSNLLCTAYWNDGTDIGNTWAATAGYDWTLNNLMVGKTYALQVWVNDSRLNNLGQNNPGLFTSVMDLNGNSVNLEHNVDNVVGGVGQYVIGTFTADAPSQALKLVGGNAAGADTSGSTATALLNAYQLRDISPTGGLRFTSVVPAGSGLIFSGTNGPASGAYELLHSADLSVPLGNWQSVGVRAFDANGSFNFTNSPASAAVAFYRLHVISSAPVFAPSITQQPQSVAIAVGQAANFNVTAIGTEPLSYQWYFNTYTILSGQTNATLTLSSAQLTNAGKYSVTITNPFGSTNSAFATLTVNPEVLAFPEAEGYGKYTVGGRGGVVYEVTNLNDSGAGSLRAAVQASGPRTIVFRVSGTILLNSSLNIANPYLTIAGQTAPGDGICLRRHTLNINADQVIIRYIRVRYGDEIQNDADAVSMRYRKNIILDHVTASWGDDETLSLYHGENITVQWCMISETLNRGGTHGFAGIWGSQYSTFHHNLVAHCVSRNMRFASGCGYTDYRNNVIYNWDYNSAYGAEAHQVNDTRTPPIEFSQVNMVNNYYKPGPATESSVSARIVNPSYRTVKTDYGQFYVAGNYVVGNATVTADNWNGGVNPQGGSGDIPLVKLNDPWLAMAINQQSAQDAYAAVLQHAGCSRPARDALDLRLISEVGAGTATYGTNGIIESQSEVGGWPTLNSTTAPTDSDHDGMPDTWETAHGLNPNNAADRNTIAPNGYTMLENYLNELGAF